jgi:hypothetical protein
VACRVQQHLVLAMAKRDLGNIVQHISEVQVSFLKFVCVELNFLFLGRPIFDKRISSHFTSRTFDPQGTQSEGESTFHPVGALR